RHPIEVKRILSRFVLLVLCCFIGFSLKLAGKDAEAVDRVTYKGGKVLIIQNGKQVPADKEIVLPHQIKVSTNGIFTVNDGKPRELKEGQTLNKEGMLLSPDGSIQPVMDHIAMKNGKVIVFEDGQTKPLDRELLLANGTKVLPDGTLRTPDGRLKRLLD